MFVDDYSPLGTHYLSGHVDELGTNGAYPVHLHRRSDGRCLGRTWSGTDGAYRFINLHYIPQGYYAVAFDHGTLPTGAGVADRMTPELMT